MKQHDDLICVLQARIGSTRLPAKAMLPLSGIASAVLCAKRAGNTGLNVLAVIGKDPSDDPLAQELSRHKIPFVRGSDENVLKRFLDALIDYEDVTKIVRLTADNPFVDGGFIEVLEAAFDRSAQQYFATRPGFDGLPYGMSAEIFRLGALREHGESLDPKVTEHVTAALSVDSQKHYRADGEQAAFSHLRCTMDTLDDYLRLCQVFSQTNDPLQQSWVSLCKILSDLPGMPETGLLSYKHMDRSYTKLALGTAQLGSAAYGRCNEHGMLSDNASAELISAAIDHGMTSIDTAQAYGDGVAEERIMNSVGTAKRERLFVSTKLAPGLPPMASPAEIAMWTEIEIFRSSQRLGVARLECVLLHRWEHRKYCDGRVWEKLLELRKEGKIGELGVSTQTPEETLEALEDPDVAFIQLPINILDWRWDNERMEGAVRSRPEVFMQGRSVYLQGILLRDQSYWPRIAAYDPSETIQLLAQLAERLGRSGVADLCINAVLGLPWINQIVLGAETLDQLKENVKLCSRTALDGEQIRDVRDSLPDCPEELLDPSKWKRGSNG